jgi:hypothetical protein
MYLLGGALYKVREFDKPMTYGHRSYRLRGQLPGFDGDAMSIGYFLVHCKIFARIQSLK